MVLAGRKILLGVTGGIAAYKAVEIASRLRKRGAEVHVVMTKEAAHFVTPLTFREITGQPVSLDMWEEPAHWNVEHIALARLADLVLIAPATANIIAKAAAGIADDMLTTTLLAVTSPIFFAPAMNSAMYENPVTQENMAKLQARGWHKIEPAAGYLACGVSGVGRLPEPQDIVRELEEAGARGKTLAGKKVLVTAGGTLEAIDPVRGITNLSSGRMGVALAQACRAAGAEVVLVAGQLQVAPPTGIAVHHAHSAREMHEAVMREVDNCDVFISVAAVADYHVANRSTEKLKKDGSGTPPVIELAENPDILATVARLPNAPFCVGFAAESHNVLEHAHAKRLRKGVPLIVANHAVSAMGSSNNQVTLISDSAENALPKMGKRDTADAIVAEIARLLEKAT